MSKILYQTADGVKFYQHQDAKNHALSLKDRKIVEIDGDSKREPTTKNEEFDQKNDKKSAVELIAEIEKTEALEQLTAYEVYSQKTVKAAVEKRRTELTSNTEGNLEDMKSEETKTGTGEQEEEKEVKEDKGE